MKWESRQNGSRQNKSRQNGTEDEMRIDKMEVDQMGVDEMGADEVGINLPLYIHFMNPACSKYELAKINYKSMYRQSKYPFKR